MTEALPETQRVYLTLADGGAGRVDLRLSLMPPEAIGEKMAVLVLRGVLPAGFPQDIPLAVTLSSDT